MGIMNKFDVLKRAKDILSAGPLPKSHSEHGDYCPFCAIALARTQLDSETNGGISLGTVFTEIFIESVSEHPEDAPLVDASKALHGIEPPFTKGETLRAIDKALA